MRAYFPELLKEFGNPLFLRTVIPKYHYRKNDFESLCFVARAMLPLMGKDAGWDHRLFFVGEHWETEVCMTLGQGVDTLQEHYLSLGLLSECYMVEVLASELLLQGYKAYNRLVAEETSYHVKRYLYLGSGKNYPIEGLKELLERLEVPVTCNDAYCMIPKKSVAFVAELTEDTNTRCQGICVGCRSRNCPNRMEESIDIGRITADMTGVPLNYGYSRIFWR